MQARQGAASKKKGVLLGKKPNKAQNENASGTASKINILLLVVAVIFVSGVLWYTLRSPAPDTRAALPKPSVTTLDPAQFSGKVRLAYEAAREVPEVLAKLPCYCGCVSSGLHRNNLDCFHDLHGVDCTMCQDIAIDARGMYKSGFDIDRIRERIKEKYNRTAALAHEHKDEN
jgi:hypothetical protein